MGRSPFLLAVHCLSAFIEPFVQVTCTRKWIRVCFAYTHPLCLCMLPSLTVQFMHVCSAPQAQMESSPSRFLKQKRRNISFHLSYLHLSYLHLSFLLSPFLSSFSYFLFSHPFPLSSFLSPIFTLLLLQNSLVQ